MFKPVVILLSLSPRFISALLLSTAMYSVAAQAQTPATGATAQKAALPTTTTPRTPSLCGDAGCGWHFYDERPKDPENTAPRPAPALVVVPRNPKLVAAEKFQQELKELMAIAVYEPTPENVLAWSKQKHKLIVNADTMSDVHQKLMWANPQMDFTVIGRPVSQVGMATFDDARIRQRREAVAQLSKTHVLYYFARSDCQYCKNFSPMLKAFGDVTRMRVFPISVDGGAITHFPNAVADNGIAEALGVFSVPALFIADPITGTILPVGYGAMSDEEIFQRLDAFVNADPKATAATPLRPFSQGVPPPAAPAAVTAPRPVRLKNVATAFGNAPSR